MMISVLGKALPPYEALNLQTGLAQFISPDEVVTVYNNPALQLN